jgi:anti-sigma regulatory factor (Ser/Thr protein kinase)
MADRLGRLGDALNSAGEVTAELHAAVPLTPAADSSHQPASPARILPLADPEGNDITACWLLRAFLELGTLPSAVPYARLQSRQLLRQWGLSAALGETAELLVSEIVTNAVQITQTDARSAPVRLWLLSDQVRLLMLIGDSSPLPPVRMSTNDDAEKGRGLLLVEALSTRWGHFPHCGGGKVVWAMLE